MLKILWKVWNSSKEQFASKRKRFVKELQAKCLFFVWRVAGLTQGIQMAALREVIPKEIAIQQMSVLLNTVLINLSTNNTALIFVTAFNVKLPIVKVMYG